MTKRSVKSILLWFKSGFVPSFAASAFVLLLGFLPLFNSVERRFLDLSFQIRGPEKPHPDLAILDINDESLQKLGSWPWPRNYYAALLKILREAKPSVIFFDILFSEKSSAKQDLAFAEALKASGNIVLPFYFSI